MKLETILMAKNKQVQGVQTPPRKSYNPFDSDDEYADTYSKSSNNTYDIKTFETTSDSLTFNLDGQHLSWEEAIIEHSRMLKNSMAPDLKTEQVIYMKDTELFTNKTITECKVPELVFSYKDNGFHSVKDIGIDEGVPNHDKVWIKTEKSRPNNDVEKDIDVLAQSEGPVKENVLEHEVLEKPYSDEQCKIDLLKVDEFEHESSSKEINSSSSFKGTDLVESDDMANGKKDRKINDKDEEDYHKVEKMVNGVSEDKYCNGNNPLQGLEKYLAKPSIEHELEAKIDSSENQTDKITSIQPRELPASYNSSVNSRSIILEFNSSSQGSGKEEEENPQKDEAVEKPLESQIKPRDDGVAPGPSILNSGTEKMVHGETSFSAAMPLPVSITYVGPNAHNGSISLRSESSAGSTRSFAFPVLQTEWPTSPVRMAKADQRHCRKQRGWVHSLICCKY